MITLLTHISNAPLFGNVVGLVLLARRVARAIGITGTLLLGAVADTQKHAEGTKIHVSSHVSPVTALLLSRVGRLSQEALYA